MNIFKALFGGSKENSEESKKEQQNKDFEILKFDGVRALRARQAEYAVKCFRHALDLKDDDETRDYLSQALIANNEMMEAIKEMQILAEKVGDNVELYLRMANVAYMAEDYQEMHDACEKALAVEPENEKAMYSMALAYEGLSRREEAINELTKIIDASEEAYGAMLLRGNLYLKDGNNEAALADAKTLDEKYPDSEDVLMLMAQTEHKLQNLDAAEELCGKVIDLDPFNTTAFAERAAIRGEKGDKDGEKEDLQTLMELNPQETAAPDDDPTRTMEQKMKDNAINPLGI